METDGRVADRWRDDRTSGKDFALGGENKECGNGVTVNVSDCRAVPFVKISPDHWWLLLFPWRGDFFFFLINCLLAKHEKIFEAVRPLFKSVFTDIEFSQLNEQTGPSESHTTTRLKHRSSFLSL